MLDVGSSAVRRCRYRPYDADGGVDRGVNHVVDLGELVTELKVTMNDVL